MKYDKLIKDLRICACTISEPCETCSHNEAGDCYNKLKHDASNAIEELQEELQKALEAVNNAHNEGFDVGYWAGRRDYERKWIPVTERLPEVGKSVLVISYGRVCFAKLLLTINNGGYPTFVLQDGLNNPPVLETTAHNEFTENRITHWQYLPEPPKEEK